MHEVVAHETVSQDGGWQDQADGMSRCAWFHCHMMIPSFGVIADMDVSADARHPA